MKIDLLVFAAVISFLSSASFAATPDLKTYNTYFNQTLAKHFKGGLISQVQSCKSQGYQPCKDRYAGLKFDTVSIDTALFLATLAKDYSLNIHSRTETLGYINQILDGYDRLSRYSTEQSQFLVSQIHLQNSVDMAAEFKIREDLLQEMSPSGFFIREDLGVNFDRFADALVAVEAKPTAPAVDPLSFVRPEAKDYVAILFGLASAKKYVNDPGVVYKLNQLAKKMANYIVTSEFKISNPRTRKAFSGDASLSHYEYPMLIALRYMIDDENAKPDIKSLGTKRLEWQTNAWSKLGLTRYRCDENYLAGKSRLKKCDYPSVALEYLVAALASFEDDSKIHAGNVSFFKKYFLKKSRTEKELNPVLSAIALDYYGQSENAEIILALHQLEGAPTEQLPNTWSKSWKRFFEVPLSFKKNSIPSLPDQNSDSGIEFPGTDYLMPFVYSAFRQ